MPVLVAVLPGQHGCGRRILGRSGQNDLPGKAAAVMSSMAWPGSSCQRAGGSALDQLARFRRGVYGCLWRRAEALFETMDAVLTAGPAPSLPYLSLEPVLRRGHGMVYQGLARGRVDEEALRDLLVAWRPRDWPLVFAAGASTYPRPWAVTSPGREWHHHACPGSHGSDGAAVAGWAFQWLAQLSFDPDSRTAPQDQVRVGAGSQSVGKIPDVPNIAVLQNFPCSQGNGLVGEDLVGAFNDEDHVLDLHKA